MTIERDSEKDAAEGRANRLLYLTLFDLSCQDEEARFKSNGGARADGAMSLMRYAGAVVSPFN